MKNLIIVMICLFSLNSFAQRRGPGDGGGGKGIVCRNADGSIKSVELLDLWEAENVWERLITQNDADVKTQVESYLSALKDAARWNGAITSQENPRIELTKGDYFYLKANEKVPLYLELLKYQGQNFKWKRVGMFKLFRNVKLKPTEDSFERAEPSQCPVEQIVRYDDDELEVKINFDLFEKMSKMHQAALIVHEVLYYYLRRGPVDMYSGKYESNSLRTRRAVGLAVTEYKFESFDSLIPKNELYIVCREATEKLAMSTYTEIAIVPVEGFSPISCYNAYAEYINGSPVLGNKKTKYCSAGNDSVESIQTLAKSNLENKPVKNWVQNVLVHRPEVGIYDQEGVELSRLHLTLSAQEKVNPDQMGQTGLTATLSNDNKVIIQRLNCHFAKSR